MALNIKDPDTERLVRALAAETGESITDAVAQAARERLDRVTGSRRGRDLVKTIESIAQRTATLPILDDRSADEIVGYDQDGLPG